MSNSASNYRARLRARSKLEKADRWLEYLNGQLTLARAAKADAEAKLHALGVLPHPAPDPDLTKLLDDM